jgi:7-keto-8-aminopelargonate synthetase-like enzyme
MGSLSKAIPASGGYLAGRGDLMVYLEHGSAPFMFSAALCPSATAAALEALAVIDSEPLRRVRLRRNADQLRGGLQDLGFDTGKSASPIVPVIVNGVHAALELARDLWLEGVMASAIIPPAVPRSESRLRLCATAAMRDEHIEQALAAFAAVGGTRRT